MANYHQRMQQIWRQYQKEISADPADLREVAAWAIKEGLWSPRPADIYARFAEDMSQALRDDYRTDNAGRRYRVNHAVRVWRDGRQLAFWADIDTAPRSHMEKAFAQRRRQIIDDCHQLRLDVDHYNGAHPEEVQLELVLDFTDDVAERLIAEGIEEDVA
jgi:hypothetical protein